MRARLLTTLLAAAIALSPLADAFAQSQSQKGQSSKSQSSKSQSAKGKGKEPKKDVKKEAAPKDARIWTIVRGEDSYALRFGLPRATDPVFALTCQPAAKLLQVTVETASPQIRSGDGVALRLSAGKKRVELAASAFRAATEGRMVVEAAVVLDSRVIDLFSDGETLVVRLPGATENYPLSGAKPRIGDFRRVCL